jgi:L-cysteine/cystine lyase
VSFEAVRAEYPVLARLAYLNAGSAGPLSRSAAEAVARERRADLEEGRGGPPYVKRVLAARERVRARFAAEIGVPAANVALTRATTDGCNIAVLGLGLGPEDEIVTSDSEHFGVLGALGASGARVRVARLAGRSADEALDAILAEVGPKTRLIALSHVLWTTGHVVPLGELKEATGLPLLVDGAQSVGAIPVQAETFDFYTVSGQKWLCCPDSSGALYVRDPDALAVKVPTYFSQAGYAPDGSFTPKDGAARFDNGWIAVGLLAGIEAALDVHPEWRFVRAHAMAARCRELLDAHVEVVTEPGHGTLVAWRMPGDPAELVAHAYDQGVVIRDLPGTGLLRASCGYWTSEEDLERLVAVLASARLGGRGLGRAQAEIRSDRA